MELIYKGYKIKGLKVGTNLTYYNVYSITGAMMNKACTLTSIAAGRKFVDEVILSGQ